ncbi:MAG: hypothetical protein ACLS2V_12935 [Clostridium paraputrificum]|uniref:hypothetical protein n=1 Tax=Clostridium sp. TaxID=1506 RepID=UPI0025C467E9|nr:hypothetical protein [Clostridium sp.]MBS5926226.1 hypothetical protein [Clostridium sp.]
MTSCNDSDNKEKTKKRNVGITLPCDDREDGMDSYTQFIKLSNKAGFLRDLIVDYFDGKLFRLNLSPEVKKKLDKEYCKDQLITNLVNSYYNDNILFIDQYQKAINLGIVSHNRNSNNISNAPVMENINEQIPNYFEIPNTMDSNKQGVIEENIDIPSNEIVADITEEDEIDSSNSLEINDPMKEFNTNTDFDKEDVIERVVDEENSEEEEDISEKVDPNDYF